MEYVTSYGQIADATFESYAEHEFAITVTTTRDFVLSMRVGGSPKRIRDYDPESTKWGTHKRARICAIHVVRRGK